MPNTNERRKERDTGDILSAQQAAQLLGISKQTLIRRTQDKSIPGRKLGKIWLYRASTLAALVP